MKQKTSSFKTISVFIFLSVFLTFTVKAQIKVNSPYSRFGLGEIYSHNSGSSFGMGGASFALWDSTRINSMNPASLMAMDSAFFLFDFGMNGSIIETKSSTTNSRSNYFNLAHFDMAFPVTKKYRSGFGLNPFSEIGYDVETSKQIDSIGNVDFSYYGNGGLSQFRWGNAFMINKNLTAGINISYLFGTMNTHRTSTLTDIADSYKYRVTNSVAVGGLYYDFGVLYKINLPKEYSLRLAAVFTPQLKVGATNTIFAETYSATSEDYEVIQDTVSYNEKSKGDMILPMKIGAGFNLSNSNKWKLAGDVEWQKWEDFSSLGWKDSLVNSLTYRLGYNYYYKKVNYRLGMHYTNTNLKLKGEQINDLGFSIGTGFLIRQNNRKGDQSFSYVDLGIEVGRRGTLTNNLLQQDYIKLYMSLSIKNEWFRKVKFQ